MIIGDFVHQGVGDDELKGKTMKLLDNALLCQNCGLEWLHQVETNVFEREPDAEDGFHVRITRKLSTVDRHLDENPSGRRSGLSITFSCEQCDALPVLNIYQHKGQTFVEWATPIKSRKDVPGGFEDVLDG